MAVIGIDLGTTNSLASAWLNGESVLIPNSLGKFLTPSVVSVDTDGSIITGETAKQCLVSQPDRTASLFKQFMGTSKTYTLGKKTFRPEDLSALILRSLKADAESYLNEKVDEAIISVPAYFNDAQRSATKNAGILAGLNVERILNEPSAAALAYRRFDIRDGTSLVFDFGGGTLDVSVLEAFDNIVDIIAVSGDNRLGGSDIDKAIMNAFLHEHPELADVLTDKLRGILLKNAEACKISLTDHKQVFMVYRHKSNDYSMVLDDEKLMRICSPLFVKFGNVIKRALQNAGIPLSMIDNMILVGGSCRMPLVREYLTHLFQRTVLSDIDPDFAVAYGVGMATGIKSRDESIRDMVLTDICPFSLGVEAVMDGVSGVFDAIIPRNTTLPASRVHSYTTLHNNQTEVTLNIYQGESLDAARNLRLGQCEIDVPPLPAGMATVDVRFSYDINGILEVEANCEQNGSSVRELIIGNNRLTKGEINARLAQLNKLKTSPRGEDENNLTIARGQRLYEEFSGEIQEEVMRQLMFFKAVLQSSGNPARIARLRSELNAFFDRLDKYSEDFLLFGKPLDYDYFEPEE